MATNAAIPRWDCGVLQPVPRGVRHAAATMRAPRVAKRRATHRTYAIADLAPFLCAHAPPGSLIPVGTSPVPSGGETPTLVGGLLDASGSFSEGKPGLSRLSNQLMCRTCRRWCAVPLHRTKHLKGRAGRAQTGGHDDLTFMTSAPQHHGAFWHFPPRRARSLKARANYATHPTPRARKSIGSVSVVITT